jgi:hypothetical protein
MSAMHRAAKERVRRAGLKVVRLAYAPEHQQRGMLHWHVVLGATSGSEMAGAEMYVECLRELAGRYGFGPQIHRGHWGDGAQSVAGYASKLGSYVSKVGRESVVGKQVLRMLHTNEWPARATYVHQLLLSETRCTMRALRMRRYVYAVWGPVEDGVRDTALELLAAFPGSYLEAPGDRAPPADSVSTVDECTT